MIKPAVKYYHSPPAQTFAVLQQHARVVGTMCTVEYRGKTSCTPILIPVCRRQFSRTGKLIVHSIAAAYMDVNSIQNYRRHRFPKFDLLTQCTCKSMGQPTPCHNCASREGKIKMRRGGGGRLPERNAWLTQLLYPVCSCVHKREAALLVELAGVH